MQKKASGEPFDIIFFDLDGTLIDSSSGILRSIIFALEEMDKKIPSREHLLEFIGPPLADSFRDILAFNDRETKQAVQLYRKRYRAKGKLEVQVYPEIPELLQQLQEEHKNLVVATSKPEIFAKEILQNLQLDQYFRYICGGDLDGKRKTKAEVIRYALDLSDLSFKDSVVMVGDRDYDVAGADQFGIPCIGVLYGFGTKAELERAGVIALAESPLHILDFI